MIETSFRFPSGSPFPRGKGLGVRFLDPVFLFEPPFAFYLVAGPATFLAYIEVRLK
jgi:hypothetical protein